MTESVALDITVRSLGVGWLALTAAVLLLTAPRTPLARAFLPFAVGIAGFLAVNTAFDAADLPSPAWDVASFCSRMAAVFLWLFCVVLSEGRWPDARVALCLAAAWLAQRGRVFHAGVALRVGHQFAGVVAEVAQSSESIQRDHRCLRHRQGECEALDHGLVMARLAGGGPMPAGPQRRERALHDAFVAQVETRLRAETREIGIGHVAGGRIDQLLQRLLIRVVPMQQPDRHQILQGHRHPPSGGCWNGRRARGRTGRPRERVHETLPLRKIPD